MGLLLMKKQLDMKIESDKIKHFTVCVIVGLTASVIEAVYGANYLQSFFAGYMAGLAIGVWQGVRRQVQSLEQMGLV